MDVRSIRKRLGLRQTDLAEILGVHHITVSQWERGKARPRPWHHALIGQFSTISPDTDAGQTARIQLRAQGPIRALYELLQHSAAGHRVAAFDAAIPSR